MECQECGADLVARTQPCVFCGETYTFQLPVKVAPFHRKVLMGIALTLFALMVTRCMQSATYNQVTYLRSPEFGPVLWHLSAGETEEARKAAKPFYDSDWYSGFPGGVIAAAYYRDYMDGDEAALAKMAPYAKKAYQRDPNFVSRYFYAVYLYHQREYEEALKLVLDARKELSGISRWIDIIDRGEWQKANGSLIRACERSIDGSAPSTPTLSNHHHDDLKFKVVFKI